MLVELHTVHPQNTCTPFRTLIWGQFNKIAKISFTHLRFNSNLPGVNELGILIPISTLPICHNSTQAEGQQMSLDFQVIWTTGEQTRNYFIALRFCKEAFGNAMQSDWINKIIYWQMIWELLKESFWNFKIKCRHTWQWKGTHGNWHFQVRTQKCQK